MSECLFRYVGFGDYLFFIEVDMEHDFFVSDVGVVVLNTIEGSKDGMVLICIFN